MTQTQEREPVISEGILWIKLQDNQIWVLLNIVDCVIIYIT